MLKRKKSRKKTINKKKSSPPQSSWRPEQLKRELSDPDKMQKYFNRLRKILETSEAFKSLLFPAEKLMQSLDKIAVDLEKKLAILETDDKRLEIFRLILPQFVTPQYANSIEKNLTSYLTEKKVNKKTFAAISTGLFFVEWHRKNPQKMHLNPLWDLVFSSGICPGAWFVWVATLPSSNDWMMVFACSAIKRSVWTSCSNSMFVGSANLEG